MVVRELTNADKIKEAVAAIKALRPAYKDLLGFYEKLYLAQEASREETRVRPIEIPEDVLSVKQEERFPLINMADFAVDVQASEALLRRLCMFALEANEVLAQAAPRIEDALDREALDSSALFSSLLQEGNTYLDDAAGRLHVDKKILTFAVYNSIKPSLSLCAEHLKGYLDKEEPWEKGYCPICGSLPALSVLRGEAGERSLICSFCSHEWRIRRMCCPFCDNREQKTLHYFFSEEEQDYRVDVCDRCRKYIKTVDTRQMTRPMYPFVEQVCTLHLDMLAQEQGLESGLPLWFQM